MTKEMHPQLSYITIVYFKYLQLLQSDNTMETTNLRNDTMMIRVHRINFYITLPIFLIPSTQSLTLSLRNMP